MYEAFYNLSKKPFQLNPDPQFFFNSAVHKRALAYLRYGLAQGQGFIVVTGSPGTGKTTLVKALFEELKNENIVIGLMVTTHLNAEDTLRIVASSFGLGREGSKASLLKNLEEFFKKKNREGKRVLLIVDEAQNLPLESLEELRMLANFELNGKQLFQSFLLGQDQFRQILQQGAMEQVRQRITATYNLRALDNDETQAYILHRLKTAGWNHDPDFKDEAFAEICKFTKGVPRIINSLCDRLLLYGFLEELHIIDEKPVQTVVKEIEKDQLGNSGDKSKHLLPSSPSKMPISARSMASGEGMEERVQHLENSVESLKQIILKERALLRKAVLIQLDMDDVYESTDVYETAKEHVNS